MSHRLCHDRSARVLVGTVCLVAALVALAACGGASTKSSSGISTYVALGDSYTAAPLVPHTDLSNPCLRSSNNYPSLVARALHVEHFVDRSCGGAQTKDMTGSQRKGVPPQLDGLTKDTDLVTVGIGANDFGIATALIVGCVSARYLDPTGAPCRAAASRSGADKLLAVMPQLTQRVGAVLSEVRQRSPHARIVVVGYPQSVPDQGTCAALPLATGDYAYELEINRAVNDAVHEAATNAHATWIDIWDASAGHDICSADPWVNGATNLPDKAAAYHPFGAEQDVVAALILKAIRQAPAS